MASGPPATGEGRPLLAVTAMSPWPVRDGYGVRAANLLEQLARRRPVVLVSPAPTEPPREAVPEGVDWRPVEGVPGTTALPWRDERSRLVERVESALAERAYGGALLWSGAEFLVRSIPDFPPAVSDRIDCEALQAWRNRGHREGFADRLRLLRKGLEMALYERRTLSRFEGVVVTGPDDARVLRRLTGQRRVAVIPNGVRLPELDGLPGEGEEPRVIFTGVLDYGPNVEAVRHFVREVWPAVRERIPGAVFVVAGRSPAPVVERLAREPGVALRLDVPDLTTEIREAWVAVAPMRSGSGIKNKVLEAWAAERPVVLSELATNGLDFSGAHGEALAGLVCRDRSEMAETVTALLRDRPRRRELGRRSRSLAEENHGWEAAGGRLERFLATSGLGGDAATAPDAGSPPRRAAGGLGLPS